jgi:photosystem II stability/assembly factor-like uncharacterized protein
VKVSGRSDGPEIPAPSISVATSSDGETVYVGDLSDVWKSRDGGSTWTELRKVVPEPQAGRNE